MILLNICYAVSWIYIILRILVQYDTMSDLIILLGQCGYLQCCFMNLHHTSDIGSVWHNEWPHNTSRSIWPIYHGSVILLNISNPIWCIYIILQVLVQYDTMGDFILLLGQCDLYFMVHWFCLISAIPFDGFNSYLGYCFSMTLWVIS